MKNINLTAWISRIKARKEQTPGLSERKYKRIMRIVIILQDLADIQQKTKDDSTILSHPAIKKLINELENLLNKYLLKKKE